MTKFVTLLGRKSDLRQATPPITQLPTIAPQPEIAPAPVDPAPSNADVNFDDDLFAPIATKLGEENEAIRHLLREAEHKIGELDTVKLAIAKLIDPVSDTLRGYEETKSQKLILERAFNNAQQVCNKLRDDLAAAQGKTAAFKTECARLQEIATAAKNSMATLERTNASQLAELAEHRIRTAELQRSSQQQSSDLQLARVENLRLGERCALADQRAVELEAQMQTIQQQYRQAEQERASVHISLDKAFNELAQTTRRLSDTEKVLASTQSQYKALEHNLAALQAERSQLSTALEETTHQYRDEFKLLSSRFETLQARSSLTENLLNEARQALAARADETRALERRLIDASTTHDALGEKLGGAEAALAESEAQVQNLEQERASLIAHGRKLIEVANEREVAQREAQQQIREQSDLLARLQEELNAARNSAEIQIEHFKAQLQREQLERSIAEGALESARKDMSRLLQEISSLRGRPLSQSFTDSPAAPDALKQAA
jgi:crescentin